VQGVASGSGGTALAGFAGDPGAIPIVAQGASGQTANLQEWRNGSGKVSAVSANGAIIAPQVGQQIPNINYGNAGTSNPAGTISKNMVMCGIKFLFTPKVSGNIIGFFHGDIASTMVGGRPRAQINYGAGTPPNNGDAVTGNIITTLEDAIGYGSNQVMPVTFPFTVSATNNGGPLVVGTQYWFDAAQAAAVGGTATLTNVYFVILEI
jgi:hypothetical protein